MATHQEIMAQIKQLKKEAAAARRAEKAQIKRDAEAQRRSELSGVISQIRDMMKQHGLTVADLGGGRGRPKSATAGVKGEIRYANPAGGKGWTGKGRKPAWVVEALAQGRALSDFAINK
jgi:DNA-binding protein H-NS